MSSLRLSSSVVSHTMDTLDPASYRPVSNLTFVSIETRRKHCERASIWICWSAYFAASCSVSISSVPFHRNSGGGNAQRHDWCTWSWWDWSSGSSWHVCCIRHGRPQRAPGYNGTSVHRYRWCVGVDIGLHPQSITDGARRRGSRGNLFDQHGLRYHFYAAQFYGKLSDAPRIASAVAELITDVKEWCASMCLQLNTTKTEVMWFGSKCGRSTSVLRSWRLSSRSATWACVSMASCRCELILHPLPGPHSTTWDVSVHWSPAWTCNHRSTRCLIHPIKTGLLQPDSCRSYGC